MLTELAPGHEAELLAWATAVEQQYRMLEQGPPFLVRKFAQLFAAIWTDASVLTSLVESNPQTMIPFVVQVLAETSASKIAHQSTSILSLLDSIAFAPQISIAPACMHLPAESFVRHVCFSKVLEAVLTPQSTTEAFDVLWDVMDRLPHASSFDIITRQLEGLLIQHQSLLMGTDASSAWPFCNAMAVYCRALGHAETSTWTSNAFGLLMLAYQCRYADIRLSTFPLFHKAAQDRIVPADYVPLLYDRFLDNMSVTCLSRPIEREDVTEWIGVYKGRFLENVVRPLMECDGSRIFPLLVRDTLRLVAEGDPKMEVLWASFARAASPQTRLEIASGVLDLSRQLMAQLMTIAPTALPYVSHYDLLPAPLVFLSFV
jgi:hypothetical protein